MKSVTFYLLMIGQWFTQSGPVTSEDSRLANMKVGLAPKKLSLGLLCPMHGQSSQLPLHIIIIIIVVVEHLLSSWYVLLTPLSTLYPLFYLMPSTH